MFERPRSVEHRCLALALLRCLSGASQEIELLVVPNFMTHWSVPLQLRHYIHELPGSPYDLFVRVRFPGNLCHALNLVFCSAMKTS